VKLENLIKFKKNFFEPIILLSYFGLYYLAMIHIILNEKFPVLFPEFKEVIAIIIIFIMYLCILVFLFKRIYKTFSLKNISFISSKNKNLFITIVFSLFIIPSIQLISKILANFNDINLRDSFTIELIIYFFIALFIIELIKSKLIKKYNPDY